MARRFEIDRRASRALCWALALGTAGVACSDSGSNPAGSAASDAGESRDGGLGHQDASTPGSSPAVDVVIDGPITDAGGGVPFLASPLDLAVWGYVEEEFFLEGEATAYEVQGEQGSDGKWALSETTRAPFKTRVLVRRPKDAANFNGTVLVEWLNVSAGIESSPGFAFMWEEVLNGGYAWVGVSAQSAGVEGGGFAIPLPGLEALLKPLVEWDPERYGSLAHPGDDYSYDLFSQVGDVLRHPGEVSLLAGFDAERVIAYGESQSAMRMVSYVNGVHPLVHVYDGFFIHSRALGGTPIAGGANDPGFTNMTRALIRDDLDAPVLQFQTETDLFSLLGGSYSVRQPDTDRLRTWEVAGTAHADRRQLDYQMPGLDLGCGMINAGPQHYVVKAAVHALAAWIENGTPPPMGEPLQANDTEDGLAVDEHGNALGGVRTPPVDVPVATYEGQGDSAGGILCALFGKTIPFSADVLKELYPTHADYVQAVKASAASAREKGFVLPREEATLVQEAQAAPVPE